MHNQYSASKVCTIVGGHFIQQGADEQIQHFVYDSRAVPYPLTSLFFAIKAARKNGHFFLNDAFAKGVRNFVVEEEPSLAQLGNANIIKVPDVLTALQKLAAHHRKLFSIPVIGITGSNGKTIVKEWLYQLLHADHKIARSPRSFNSQIGVPLSVWQLNKEHTLGIFEAGISMPGEMEKLEAVISPTIGVFTNLGEAHNEGFLSPDQKKREKAILFKGAEIMIGPYEVVQGLNNINKTFSWGIEGGADLLVSDIKIGSNTQIDLKYKEQNLSFLLPFRDEASVQNGITCIAVLLYLKYDPSIINERLGKLDAIDMRLQLKHGINNCTLINDSYSADLTSLTIALHFLAQQQTAQQRTVILSDFIETGKEGRELYKIIADLLALNKVKKVIAVGADISNYLPPFLDSLIGIKTYDSTEDFLANMSTTEFVNETILIKGARKAGFERVVQALETKVHQTQLEINLGAIAHNLNEYKKLLAPQTKVMAMVKAFSYGSGTFEIASVLQFQKVDYLGVAYADEGIALRKAGISLPLMVMNVDDNSFEALVVYSLQPVIYSLDLLLRFEGYLQSQGITYYPVHLEIETGMHRLGFDKEDMDKLKTHLSQTQLLKIESVFSHLAASETAEEDDFTLEQVNLFKKAADSLQEVLSYSFITHIANSAAIIRHPYAHLDMVRLGIGLYGIEISSDTLHLQEVATLRATIAQLKHIKQGETVSYNRKGVAERDSIIATVRIGYADGYSRRFGNGKGKMRAGGKLAPVMGAVCMDMTMIDVTDVPLLKEGDEVIVFGNHLPLQELARWADTIPYEIMTSISQRVKRVYYQE